MACCSERIVAIIRRWIILSSLKWANIIEEYTLFEMMTYLSETWGLGFAHAAGTINVFYGFTKILSLSFAFLMDAYLGNVKMLLLSGLASSIGLAFLSMSSAPPVLFFTSLVLMCVGMAGNSVSLDTFLQHHDSENNKLNFIVGAIAALALPLLKTWEVRFGVAGIIFFAATLIFFVGTLRRSYPPKDDDDPNGSALTTVLRVFVAATRKRSHQLPANSNDLYQRHGNDHDFAKQLAHTNRCRWLDKAAVASQGKSGRVDEGEEKKNKEEESKLSWNLCTVGEVEETKICLQTAILWTSFIICGLVSSTGNTFFVGQADQMNRGIGKWQVHPTILLLLSNGAKYLLEFNNKYEYRCLRKCLGCCGCSLIVALVSIATAMLNAVLCCLSAAVVESRRRKNIDSPMSIFWLIPQFYFLTVLDTLFEEAVEDFFEDHEVPTLKKYAVHLLRFVRGLGQVGSVVSVAVCKKWFKKEVNESRLDKYYWVLTALSGVNLIWYVIVAVVYYVKFKPRFKSKPAADPTSTPTTCCC
ncbi:PREDICTED: protein NRT1/ PTR FAMILY 5.5-like [Ipomoea nil]|uniref:protein NRT1/ PTR FAMILY 5.5-like n=1 Tax=Ipomoea nil TaxID=35883 RepID=UPI00090166F1|nr:PREDICTED: protein NRT1/ PTR FAMILY 5.5-like [Ipomoea nil]